VLGAQFAVIVDFTICDKRGGASEEGLIASRQINDRKAGLGECDIARNMMPRPIRPAMRQRTRQSLQHRGGG
jgi:hypothetical protein